MSFCVLSNKTVLYFLILELFVEMIIFILNYFRETKEQKETLVVLVQMVCRLVW